MVIIRMLLRQKYELDRTSRTYVRNPPNLYSNLEFRPFSPDDLQVFKKKRGGKGVEERKETTTLLRDIIHIPF